MLQLTGVQGAETAQGVVPAGVQYHIETGQVVNAEFLQVPAVHRGDDGKVQKSVPHRLHQIITAVKPQKGERLAGHVKATGEHPLHQLLHDDGNAHPQGRALAADAAHLAGDVLKPIQQRACQLGEALPGLGGLQRLGAQEQLDAELVLQLLNGSGDRRLRNIQCVGRSRHVAVFIHRLKVLKLQNGHAHTP